MEVSGAIVIILLRGTNYLGTSFRPGMVSLKPDAVSCNVWGRMVGNWLPTGMQNKDKMSQLGIGRSTPSASKGDPDPWLVKMGLFLIQISCSVKS